MVALVDIDSLFYKAAYMLDHPEFVASKGLSHLEGEELASHLAEFAADRLETMLNNILIDVSKDENGIEISKVEIYVTACKNSVRKQIYPEYKIKRVPNLIVNCLRSLYIFRGDAMFSDEWEADDLIADRARELGEFGCIIISIDKDLTTLGGFRYDFYCKPSMKDSEGNVIERYPPKGLTYTPKFEAKRFLAKQICIGDATDNIKGLPNYGEKKAEKDFKDVTTDFGLKKKVISLYKKYLGESYECYADELKKNFRLVFLGKLLTPTLQIDNNN